MEASDARETVDGNPGCRRIRAPCAQIGAGGIEPPFDGESLSRHGVVVITIQYRLGLLGFIADPELTAESPHHASGNYALMDIIAALEWVKQNVEKFGGDPANVTIFGQSAAGNNVGIMLVSPLSKGLFARAIEERGTVIGVEISSQACSHLC